MTHTKRYPIHIVKVVEPDGRTFYFHRYQWELDETLLTIKRAYSPNCVVTVEVER